MEKRMVVGHGCSRRVRLLAVAAFVVVVTAGGVSAQTVGPPSPLSFDNPANIPDLSKIFPSATDSKGVSVTLQILVLMTVVTLVPSILIMMTAFPRVIIVFALLRQAVGTPQLPPGQVLLGLSLFLTMLIMAPTWQKIQTDALTPYLANNLGQSDAFDITAGHLKDFMYRQITQANNDADVYLFLEYHRGSRVAAEEEIVLDDIPLTVMIPAFMLSELKTAFIMGFRVYLPFLVIDMVIATVLLSMGMMMLPPVLISLPFKILLFVLADGWHLLVETLLSSFV